MAVTHSRQRFALKPAGAKRENCLSTSRHLDPLFQSRLDRGSLSDRQFCDYQEHPSMVWQISVPAGQASRTIKGIRRRAFPRLLALMQVPERLLVYETNDE